MPIITPTPTQTKPRPERFDYAATSRQAGALMRVQRRNYTVGFKQLMTGGTLRKARAFVFTMMLTELGFIYWLLLPSHFPVTYTIQDQIGTMATIGALAVIEGLRLIHVTTMGLSTLSAQDPIPVRAKGDLKVAFITTIVPSKEPIEIAVNTLRAMKKVQYNGVMDIWLLDEGNDPEVRRVCKELGVKHFSRHGIEKWNTPSGAFRAKTKHGNLNAWLDEHGYAYDVAMCIDTDHAPLPNFARRMLGYFRDPNVAFVVGPQVYGNVDNFITKGAESQAYVFQATIQRAANRFNAAMFVGTNNAFRVATWKQIGGFQDSITEDLRTSLAVYTTRNPASGQRWKSVYTPDVVAVGEGPSSWTDFFTQQLRWARGSNEIVKRYYWRYFWKLSLAQKLHYTLILTFYPGVAIAWSMGAVVGALYLIGGFTGPTLSMNTWLALYLDASVAQYALYVWMRKYDVSPHERTDENGLHAIAISILASPVYVTALISAILNRKAKFVVTAKGDSTSPDSLGTFSRHLMWAGIYLTPVILAFVYGHLFLTTIAWSLAAFAVCIFPVTVWLWPRRHLPVTFRLPLRLRQPFASSIPIKETNS